MSHSKSIHLFRDSSQASSDLLTVTAIRGSCSIASLPSSNRPRDAHLQEITPYARQLSTFHARTFIKMPATLEGPRRSVNSNDLCKRKLCEFALQIDFASSHTHTNTLKFEHLCVCEVLIYCGGHPEPAAELSFVLILQLSFGVLRMGEGTSFWRFSEANKSCEWKYFFFQGEILIIQWQLIAWFMCLICCNKLNSLFLVQGSIHSSESLRQNGKRFWKRTEVRPHLTNL